MFGLSFLLFCLGIAVGSFLMVVVERYDTAESIWVGRSHCNHCKKDLAWWELVPILGYILIGGQCPQCKKKIPSIYPLVEALTGAVFVAVGLAANQPINYGSLFFELLFVSSLLALAYYDWLNRAFPREFLIVSAALALILLGLTHWWPPLFNSTITINDPVLYWLTSPTKLWVSSLWGLAIGALFLGLFAVPSREKWMGYGDVLLGAVLGFWLGYPFIILGLILAFYGGAIIGSWLLWGRKIKDHRIAFGPFLIFGSLAAQVWGQALFRAIMSLWNVS